MYGVSPTKQPEVFYTIPLMQLQTSPQYTFPETPQMTHRSPGFSPMDATKQSLSFSPPASPVGLSGQTQHTSIGDTPRQATKMRIRKLSLPTKEASVNEAYTPTQSIRTLTSINTTPGSSDLKTPTLGAPRPASAVSPDSQYYNTRQPSTGGYSEGSDNVFLYNSHLTTKPMDSTRDSVEYESGPVYYNEAANLPDPKAALSSTQTLISLGTAYPPPPPLPQRPRKPPPPIARKPDYLHSRNPFAKPGPPDPFMGSGAVVGLTKKTFKKFIKDLDAAFVMFYNPCDKKCCGARATMRQAAHTTQKENHAFAAVDCTKECELCNKELVRSFPTMKLYVKGMTVNTYEHVPLLTSEIRNYVENAPIVREVTLEKHRCIIQ